MKIDRYHPIRQKMVWVALIQFVASGLVLGGLSADIIQGWAAWLISGLNIAVLAGVLVKGTTEAENNTTPLDDIGEPLNAQYYKLDG